MVVWLFGRLKDGLKKTHDKITAPLGRLLTGKQKIDEALLEDLENTFLQADIGVETSMQLVGMIREIYRQEKNVNLPLVLDKIETELIRILKSDATELKVAEKPSTVILVVGVNGTGKTTFIAKLSDRFIKDGKKVLLAACDTFRAAAIEQLTTWADRVGAGVIKHQYGADAAAVAYDAAEAAVARKMDHLIIDTAGRLHTKINLMEEIKKIQRILEKKIPAAPHETLLVLDATTGQNALQQARIFDDALGLTGLVLTKLDGTAKGGIVIAIQREFHIPVKFIGVGEKMEDLLSFEPGDFVKAIFE